MSALEPVKGISSFPGYDGHRLVVRFEDASVGLKGFIAIHNDNLGPATGGTRMFPYVSEDDALRDVLRLSRAMTYKCALAGVRHGGGKAVIIGDPDKDKSEQFIRSYAKKINDLNGRLYTGEDVGITEDDVQVMLQESKFFIGKRGVAGDPSPYAALSTFYAIETAMAEVFGSEKLQGKSVAIKGIGKVGSELARLLIEAGAKVVAADIRSAAIQSLLARFPSAKAVDAEVIHRQLVDVFAPCAMGSDVTPENIGEIHARIICGGANNQIVSHETEDELARRRMLYVPDYVANAGGLINVVDELETDGYSRKRVLNRIKNIKKTLSTIYLLARQKNQAPIRVANRLAEEIFSNGNNSKIMA